METNCGINKFLCIALNIVMPLINDRFRDELPMNTRMRKGDPREGAGLEDLPIDVLILVAVKCGNPTAILALSSRASTLTTKENLWFTLCSKWTPITRSIKFTCKGTWQARAKRAKCLLTQWEHGSFTDCFTARHDGSVFMSLSSRNAVGIYKDSAVIYANEKNEGLIKETLLQGHAKPIACVRQAGKWTVTGGTDSLVNVWRSGHLLHTLCGHSDQVNALQFEPLRWIISGGEDSVVIYWRWPSAEGQAFTPLILRGHLGPVTCLYQWGDLLLSGSVDRSIIAWDLRAVSIGRIVFKLNDWHPSTIFSVQFDKSRLVTGSEDGIIRIWNWSTLQGNVFDCKPCHQLYGHRGPIVSLQFDKHKLVTGSSDRTIKAWSMDSEKTRHLLWTLDSNMEKQRPLTLCTLGGGMVWQVFFDETRLICSTLDGMFVQRSLKPVE